MKYKIKINKISGNNSLKAFANVTFDDCFVVTGIKVVTDKNGDFVAMPNRENKNGEYEDICFPVTAEFRKELFDAILEEYNKA